MPSRMVSSSALVKFRRMVERGVERVARHEGHVALERLREQLHGGNALWQRRPEEHAALGLGEAHLGGEELGHGVGHRAGLGAVQFADLHQVLVQVVVAQVIEHHELSEHVGVQVGGFLGGVESLQQVVILREEVPHAEAGGDCLRERAHDHAMGECGARRCR